MGDGMSTNTRLPVVLLSSQPTIAATIPDAAVTSARSAPTTRNSWDGLIGALILGRSDMARERSC